MLSIGSRLQGQRHRDPRPPGARSHRRSRRYAYRRARSQPRVTHAVGHELGDEQLRIIEHLVGDLGESHAATAARAAAGASSPRPTTTSRRPASPEGTVGRPRSGATAWRSRAATTAAPNNPGAGPASAAARLGVASNRHIWVSSDPPRGPAQDAGGPEASPRVDTEDQPSRFKVKLKPGQAASS